MANEPPPAIVEGVTIKWTKGGKTRVLHVISIGIDDDNLPQSTVVFNIDGVLVKTWELLRFMGMVWEGDTQIIRTKKKE